MQDALVTVVEHSHYLKKAERLLSGQQIEDIASAVAADPKLGWLCAAQGAFENSDMPALKAEVKAAGCVLFICMLPIMAKFT